MTYLEPSLASWPRPRSALHLIALLSLCVFLTAPAPVTAVESVTGPGGGGMLAALLIVILTAIVLAALVIIGLILWGRKQEHISEMMLFCMKYLVHSEDEAERCASAKALGRANNPGALLVLADVVWDEEETEAVRKAASEALHEMSVHFRKYKKIIADLESEAERRDFLGIIEILSADFERGKTRYVQSAYIIGRHYMRLKRYADAREWLKIANFRNRKFNLYGDRIGYWIQVCNTRLLEEADDSFKAADYQQAREHYAVLAHGLSDADSRRCAVYLRSACVYCKLEDYRNADQALLQALEHHHETDRALTLLPLLQDILGLGDKKVEPKEKLEAITSAIDERASVIMDALSAQHVRGPKASRNVEER
jgi:tetratricopeptide (TPR) repeat protein